MFLHEIPRRHKRVPLSPFQFNLILSLGVNRPLQNHAPPLVVGEAAEARARRDDGGAGGRSVVVDRRTTAARRGQLPDVTKRHRATSG